ncbi:hypothetical protein K3495_g9311 [Podosphaera aphanis]|nr:hypothetical protein K3495_g9311 [Podosphaera aphanis]
MFSNSNVRRSIALSERQDVLRPNRSSDEELSLDEPAMNRSSRQAQDAELAEKIDRQMSLWSAMKLWWPAVLFSCAISTGMIMEGYDNLFLAQLYAFPAFCHRYGKATGKGVNCEIPAAWQATLSIGTMIASASGKPWQ